jgi:hypothetical protein
MSTVFFYQASSGDRLHLLDRQYLFNVATYAPEIDPDLIYTYTYQPDQCWTKYNGDLSGATYRQEDYVFDGPCFFRLCFKRRDGTDFDAGEADKINRSITFIPAPDKESAVVPDKSFLINESQSLITRIANQKSNDSLIFALLTDSHYTIGGTWDDTLAALRAVNEKVKFDGIIHLGDMTDGMVTAAATRCYVNKIINDLLSLNSPLYIAIGNHDSNYFGSNTEPFSIAEQGEIYLSHADAYIVRKEGAPWYYRDFPDQKMRFLFLHSFDYTEECRYGFSDACLNWLERTLTSTPLEYNILIFSHLTPLLKLQYWTDRIRGGDELIEILEKYNASPQAGKVLAYINGHNHTDQIYNGLSFSIISIGCAKTEYFAEYKPAGSQTPKRRLGDMTQELWDAMIITPAQKRLDFLRFGAGYDRTVEWRNVKE